MTKRAGSAASYPTLENRKGGAALVKLKTRRNKDGPAPQVVPDASIQAGLDRSQNALSPSPTLLFTPESSSLWRFIGPVILALLAGAVIYFFQHR